MKYDTRTGGPGGEDAPSPSSRRSPITPDMELKAERILAAHLGDSMMGTLSAAFTSEATVIAAAAIYLGKRLRSLDTIGV